MATSDSSVNDLEKRFMDPGTPIADEAREKWLASG
jgi:hypothetical protein